MLLDEISEYLSYEDIYEIKKQINLLNNQGRLLPARIAFMESRKNILKKKQLQNDGNVTKYIFEDPTPAILISLMQLTSAFITELLNIIVLSGQRTISRAIANFVAIKVISEIDNIYLNAIQDNTLNQIQSGENGDPWQPVIVYSKLNWQDRTPVNKFWYACLRCVQILYKCLYFYFFPYFVLVLNYFSPSCRTVMSLNALSTFQNNGTPTYDPLCNPSNSIFLQNFLKYSLYKW